MHEAPAIKTTSPLNARRGVVDRRRQVPLPPAPKTPKHPPAFVAPTAARLVDALPTGKDWVYGLKPDGYRALILKDRDRVRILSRR
jgi:ATP-dependent DNA ligase